MKWKFLLIAMMICLNAFSQTVTNVDAWQDGDSIIISYTLNSPQKCFITANCSVDGGKNFFYLEELSGAIGEQSPGKNKKIYWNVLQEINYLESDNVVFKVTASTSSRTQKGANATVLSVQYFKEGQKNENMCLFTTAYSLYHMSGQLGYKDANLKLKSLSNYKPLKYKYYEQAMQKERLKFYEEAVILYQKAADEGSSAAAERLKYLYYNLAVDYDQSGDHRKLLKAISYYEKAKKFGHTVTDTFIRNKYYEFAQIKEAVGFYKDAATLYTMALKLGHHSAANDLKRIKEKMDK